VGGDDRPGRALEGQHALVIGGGSGIGFESARVLGLDGATVTLAGRTVAKLERAAATLADEGVTARIAECDATDGTAVDAAVTTAADADGGLDIAVTVPGGGGIGPVLLFDDHEFMAQVGRNLTPVFHVIKYAGRAMLRRGAGSIVIISSTAAVFSTRYLGSYAAGKAAGDQLVKVAADELGPHGIRVNSVQPGMTDTPTTERALAMAGMRDAFLAGQPIARTGSVADIAAAVRYFAGPESSWVTGQTLAVDGGHTLRAFVDYAELMDIPDLRAELLGPSDDE
jgi:NAD(P)-dependent dehydrogenase (short-subunit alcohol dehydrogenase family)